MSATAIPTEPRPIHFDRLQENVLGSIASVSQLGVTDDAPFCSGLVSALLLTSSTLLYPVSLLSGCWDRWSSQKPKYQYRDHLVGQLTVHGKAKIASDGGRSLTLSLSLSLSFSPLTRKSRRTTFRPIWLMRILHISTKHTFQKLRHPNPKKGF